MRCGCRRRHPADTEQPVEIVFQVPAETAELPQVPSVEAAPAPAEVPPAPPAEAKEALPPPPPVPPPPPAQEVLAMPVPTNYAIRVY